MAHVWWLVSNSILAMVKLLMRCTCFKMSIRKAYARTWCWFLCFLVDRERMLLTHKTHFLGSLWIPVKRLLADVMRLQNKCIDSIKFTTLCKVELTEATLQCLTCNSCYFSKAIISLLPDNNTISPGIPRLCFFQPTHYLGLVRSKSKCPWTGFA